MSKVGFLLFPGFPMACLTSVIEPLRAANEITGQQKFHWCLIAQSLEDVQSSAGIAFRPDVCLKTAENLDYLLVLSAPNIAFTSPQTGAHMRRLDRHGTVLGAISGGVFPLARSGVVRDERLSVHWCYEAAFASEFPEIRRSSDVIEISARRVTASGATAAFDLALSMIETAFDGDVANEVACWFQHPMMRRSGVKQSIPVWRLEHNRAQTSDLVHRAIELFTKDLAASISVAEIADQLGITPRHLERLFKQSTGQNPSGYFRQMRMKAARQIVMYTNTTIPDIAESVGYASAKPFLKQYRSFFGLSPQEDRKRINLYRVKDGRALPSA